METNALIKALSRDAKRPRWPLGRAWWAALGVAGVVAAIVFFALLGTRPDIASAAQTGRFLFKFVVTGTLAATAFVLIRKLSRPGAAALPALLLAAPLLLAGAVAWELEAIPPSEWADRLVGTNSLLCLAAIPLIGSGPLGLFLAALRHGAPTHPRLAGAVAGLLAGGVGASFYAAHCPDDSPLFVATWYSLAVTLLALAGTWLAPRVARW